MTPQSTNGLIAETVRWQIQHSYFGGNPNPPEWLVQAMSATVLEKTRQSWELPTLTGYNAWYAQY